jgi:hypothetical protein
MVRSVFYGVAAGGAVGGILGLTLSLSEPTPLLVGLIVAGFGAAVGGATGLVLGILVLAAGRQRRPSVVVRLILVLAAMAVVTVAMWILSGRFPLDAYLLLFIVPAGVGTWFLVPVVLRPDRRASMPTLTRQST